LQKLIEIRWHGRGGQGVVTASKLLAETALSEGFYIQAFPEYGAERMGAPVKSFNRISSEVIDIHCQISDPDIIVVLDETLLETIDVIAGTMGKVMPNTPMVGALIKILDFLKPETLSETIKNTLSKKIPAHIVEANIIAAKRAYEEVKENV